MGATQSKQTKQKHNGTEKHTSADSSTPLKVSDLGETELEGHSNVSRPPPPPRLHRLSELLDPAKLDGGHVRSPSGNISRRTSFLRILIDRVVYGSGKRILGRRCVPLVGLEWRYRLRTRR